MKNYITIYLELIQDLRVKAGLTRVSTRDLKLTLLKYIVTSVLIVTASITLLSLVLRFTVVTYLMLITTTMPVAILTSILMPYLSYSYILRVRWKKIEEELSYFIVSEAATYTHSMELVNDLCELRGWDHVFKELVIEGLRLRLFRNFLTVTETISTYTKYSTSKYVNKLLSDYVLALSKGVVNSWLLSTSNELLYKLRSNTKALTQLRTTISLVIGILLSYLPSLMISISIISGITEVHPPLFTVITLIPILIFMPGKTLHLKTFNNSSPIIKLKNIVIYVVTLFIIPMLLSTLEQLTTKNVLLASAALLIINGVYNLRDFIEILVEISELPKVISSYAEAPYILVNPLKGFKEVLITCRSRSLRELASDLNLNNLKDRLPIIKSWLGRYIYYIIVKSLVNGSLSKEQLLNLRTLTLDMIEDFKHYIISLLPLMMMSLMMPWLLTSMVALANVRLTNYIVLIYIVITGYSLYVDYILYDSLGSTLITGIAMAILALMLG